MSKPKPVYDDMIDLPDDPGEPVRPNDQTPVQSYENTPVQEAAPKRRSGRTKAAAVQEPREYVQRSLYASDETFERIRRYAFENRRPAQEIYREGLLLVMKKYGIDEGVKLKDV